MATTYAGYATRRSGLSTKKNKFSVEGRGKDAATAEALLKAKLKMIVALASPAKISQTRQVTNAATDFPIFGVSGDNGDATFELFSPALATLGESGTRTIDVPNISASYLSAAAGNTSIIDISNPDVIALLAAYNAAQDVTLGEATDYVMVRAHFRRYE